MWLTLAICVAVFVSLQDILSKHLVQKVNVYVVTWAWWFFTLPFLYALLLVYPLPKVDATFWWAVLIGTFLLVLAVLYYIKSIEAADLSLSVPMLTFTPFFLLITSPIMLGEVPKPIGMIGVLFIVLGSYMFFIEDRKSGWLVPFKRLLKEKGPRYMLIVAFLFSITGNIDKIGVVHSSFFMWILVLNTTSAFLLTLIMVRRTPNFFQDIKLHWPKLICIGFLNVCALLTQMTAITMTMVPYLISVKRTSVVLSALFGFFVLKEKGIKQRLSAILLMILGVFLISFV